jgi:hypothetical protein
MMASAPVLSLNGDALPKALELIITLRTTRATRPRTCCTARR